jgi:hypothetical protein
MISSGITIESIQSGVKIPIPEENRLNFIFFAFCLPLFIFLSLSSSLYLPLFIFLSLSSSFYLPLFNLTHFVFLSLSSSFYFPLFIFLSLSSSLYLPLFNLTHFNLSHFLFRSFSLLHRPAILTWFSDLVLWKGRKSRSA